MKLSLWSLISVLGVNLVGGISLFGADQAKPNILLVITDDQSAAHTGVEGDPVVKTPTFDRLAKEGVRFPNAFCSTPSCTPARAAILAGQDFWRLEEGANLLSGLSTKFKLYPEILEENGYEAALVGKGWGPGDEKALGRSRNPAGPSHKSIKEFFEQRDKKKPFCLWWGTSDPHRPYEKDSGVNSGMPLNKVKAPPFLPDVPEVRKDLLDYYFEIERYDRELGELLNLLKKEKVLDNTLIILTSDNGMPFPRAKANLYDYGARMPLVIHWPKKIKGGRVVEDFTVLPDLAPTILEAVGLTPLPEMTGKSLWPILNGDQEGWVEATRDKAVFGRERHDVFRKQEGKPPLGYPKRALRNKDFLYIRNFAPDRPLTSHEPRNADCDNGPTKMFIIENREKPEFEKFYQLCFGPRPHEELYDLAKDPDQIQNVAADSAYADTLKKLREEMDAHLSERGDPRLVGGQQFDEYAPRFNKKK